ncbi:N-acetyltransferase family protein [Aspergillus terreus]|uniref:N-acetyltransferase family protein n=1 Tax=Aspergillus terreus TaxID=33178 RepID=A0A5M3YZ51_ASPTE|nr:hypothetical protein ATETN484_0006042200 [Aspergillus terreus]GFF11988.1 N-acetyltransferase family protein [Aspergillus terreus]
MARTPVTFTAGQLEQYLQRIGYANDAVAAGDARLDRLQQAVVQSPLAALTELQRRHLAAIPWGNSALHYSTHHSISTQPICVFEKLVTRRLDGYCMENTNLLYVVLCSLGYQVYPTGGRVSGALAGGDPNDESYIYLSHMILIVTIADKRYMVDVGFGRNGPTSPLPLQEDVSATLIAPEEMRLIKTSLAECVDQTQKFWVYQARSPGGHWIPNYSFSEMEFLPQDFGMMSFYTSQNRSSFFTQRLVCTRLILDDQLEPVGIYILSGTEVKKMLRGETEVVASFKTEDDRVRAMAEYFGMHFHEHEVQGVRGLPSQIK